MSGFKMRRLSFALPLFLLANLLPACAQSGNSAPAMSALVAREIAVLELAGGGSPLSAAERRQAAEAVASGMRGNPQVMLRNYAALAQPLQRAAQDRAYAERLRSALRYTVEEGQAAPQGLEQIIAVERQIIRAHDPTVVFDPARKHLITEASLRDFRTASGWLAQQWNLPPPSADFTAHLRDWFRADFLKADKDTAQVLATQGESFPSVVPALAKADPKRKEAVAQQVRQLLLAADPTSRDLGLRTVVAVIGAKAEQQAKEDAQLGSLCTGFPFTAESSKTCRMLIYGTLGLATVQGINNADIYAHDIYRH